MHHCYTLREIWIRNFVMRGDKKVQGRHQATGVDTKINPAITVLASEGEM